MQEFADFLGDFNKESDGGVVLASAAYIDYLLAKTPKAFLIDNKSAADMVDEYPGCFEHILVMNFSMGNECRIRFTNPAG